MDYIHISNEILITFYYLVDCYADIILTGLVLRGVDSTFVRVGWKFIPNEEIDTMDVKKASQDSKEWNLVPPESFFHPEEDEKMARHEMVKFREKVDMDSHIPESDEFLGIGQALSEATQIRWKNRWLHFDSNLVSRRSGVWQCWLEGINLYENKSDKVNQIHILNYDFLKFILTYFY